MRRLSDLPEGESREALRACCASSRWVERMLSQRPFRDLDDVYDSAERIWWDLERKDWLEAFAGHPRIGGSGDRGIENTELPSRAPLTAHRAPMWSAAEQALVGDANDDVKEQLAQANREYEERFGYIYIVCATGKSAEEMLGMCRARLANTPDDEIRIAAGEQAKITRLRLDKLMALGT